MTNEFSRVDWWDWRTGSHFIADWTGDHWAIGERELGGLCWHDVPPTEQMLQRIDSRLAALTNSVAA